MGVSIFSPRNVTVTMWLAHINTAFERFPNPPKPIKSVQSELVPLLLGWILSQRPLFDRVDNPNMERVPEEQAFDLVVRLDGRNRGGCIRYMLPHRNQNKSTVLILRWCIPPSRIHFLESIVKRGSERDSKEEYA